MSVIRRYVCVLVAVILAISVGGCSQGRRSDEMILTTGETDQKKTAEVVAREIEPVTETMPESVVLLQPEGMTLEGRVTVPKGYTRIPAETGSFLEFMRNYAMKPDGSPVLLYDRTEKYNQSAQFAVLDMPVFDSDLQQCADSIMRAYAEYFRSIDAHDKIAFHLTNGFLMDYPTWRSGKRLSVDGNKVKWVSKASYDESEEAFYLYLNYVMMYAGTLSLDEESTPIEIGQLQAGDMFLKGGSPGHCVMVADMAKDSDGNVCFLLAQGYMPAQDFHILKNPLHETDPWYYVSELEYPLVTPEYVFPVGSLKRWYGF